MELKLLPVLVVVLALTVSLVDSAGTSNVPTSISLGVVIRDQAPNTMVSCTPNGSAGKANGGQGFVGTDFQRALGTYASPEYGLVGPVCTPQNDFENCGQLGSDGTPQYAYNGTSPGNNVNSAASYYNWFHNSNQTVPLNFNLTLTLGSGNTYSIVNDSFWPLDGIGWNDHCDGHNFAFCMVANANFGYQGGETFYFEGDDDMWVFMDNKLVIDLGGAHTALSQTVDLGTLTFLQVGNVYPINFFYCERHTVLSDMAITTSLGVYCSYYDWCGVCQGNGQSCCNAAALAKCPVNSNCTQWTCGVQNAPGTTNGCQATTTPCEPLNACFTASCDINHNCIQTPLTCTGGNACTQSFCDTSTGCSYPPITTCQSTPCTNATCDPVKGCSKSPVECGVSDACNSYYCDAVKGCQDNVTTCNVGNKCYSSICDSKAGCPNAQIDCSDPDPCIVTGCSNATGCTKTQMVCPYIDACHVNACAGGTCVSTPIPCTGTNLCLQNICDAVAGCTHPPVQCPPRPCFTSACSLNNGSCVYTPLPCDDGIPCTNDSCDVTTGQCIAPPIVCTSSNACQTGTCDPTTNACVFTNVSCVANSSCEVASCNPASGCSFVPTSCASCEGASCACPNADNGCDDGNLCTTDQCNDVSLTCDPPVAVVCPTPTAYCLLPNCDPKVGCSPIPRVCDDGNPCTHDSCDNATSNCSVIPLGAAGCVSCNGVACPYDDPCHPQVCQNGQCVVTNITCDNGNLCTPGVCSKNMTNPSAYVCSNPLIQCTTTDACNPFSCNVTTGTCQAVPVVCNNGNLCSNTTCVVVAGAATCPLSAIECPFTDSCNPASCNATTGKCQNEPIVCNQANKCTNNTCVNGLCPYDLLPCGSLCNPAICESATGQCIPTPVNCNDGNPCTIDLTLCNATGPYCSNPVNATQCDDHDACTVDTCNSNAPAGTDPCQHSNMTCPASNACQTLQECNVNTGCVYTNNTCANISTYCNPYQCQVSAGGCVSVPVICANKDRGCFVAACVNNNTANGTLAGYCTLNQVPDFSSSVSNNGVLCPLVYDQAAKDAAISAGTIAGAAVGAAAAAALIGVGGKKGYDYLMAKNMPIGNVGNNPMYAPSGGAGENPLFNS